MDDTIYRQDAVDAIWEVKVSPDGEIFNAIKRAQQSLIEALPSAQPEDYTELKREFIRMASYIDVLLECSDVQRETLMGFISRLAEFMPWTERD